MNPLKTDYKNDELTPSMNGKRHYAIKDSDGVTTIYPDVILEDVSEYDVHGDEFGKDDINAMNDMANKNYEDNKVILTKVINLDEQLENAEMYAEEARLAKNNAIMYSSYAEEAAEQARIAADKASEFTPEGYNEFVSSTESHLSTLDTRTSAVENNVSTNEIKITDIETKLSMITATLSAGATSVTISNPRITTDSYFDFYTSKYGLSPTSVTVNDGVLILTFEAQTEPVTVGVKVG